MRRAFLLVVALGVAAMPGCGDDAGRGTHDMTLDLAVPAEGLDLAVPAEGLDLAVRVDSGPPPGMALVHFRMKGVQ